MSTAIVETGPRFRAVPKGEGHASATFADLAPHHYIVLRTFRRNGEAVDTPVWFAIGASRLYVFTGKNSGKVKRIRNWPMVQVAPSTSIGHLHGPYRDVVARILPADQRSIAQQLLRARYGWMIRGFERWWAWRGKDHVYLELAPVNDLTPEPAVP